jgi:hypothetical protein
MEAIQMAFDLKDYVDVAERLREFYEKHPSGRVTTAIVEMTDKLVVVRAEAFRAADAAVPAGVGHSGLAIPGVTPYTRGSELENAETSAIGRALVAAGLASKRVASADEVMAKRVDGVTPVTVTVGEHAPVETVTLPSDDDRILRAAMSLANANPTTGGSCPAHQRPWKLREGVSSKTGKEYSFWSCGSKDDNAPRGWCDKQPTAEWKAANEGRNGGSF